VAREKAAHEAKNEFMSLMCHEVRTPLNGCLASAEMLLETPLAAEQRELAKTIRVSGSILLSTVSNFLDFFKLEAGKQLDIVRTLVSLPELVGDVHCIIEAMVGRGGALALRPPALPSDLALVYCDPDRLRGILLNLYTNAAKFTKCGSISLRVRVVEPDYEPEPPPGWAGITITPSYCTRPSTE
jgi:signal transduction histidine kinase